MELLAWGSAGWGDELVSGLCLTVALALCTLPLGMLTGLGIAAMRRSSNWLACDVAIGFTTAFRSLPELLTVFLIYYGGQSLINALSQSLDFGPMELHPFAAGLIALALVFGAFSSEVFLAAFAALPPGQGEAARTLGLHRFQIFLLITGPQMLRLSLPGLSNLWQNLLKDTSLISIIALNDLLRQSKLAASSEVEPVFFYCVAFVLYLSLAVLSSIGIGRVRSWSDRGFGSAAP